MTELFIPWSDFNAANPDLGGSVPPPADPGLLAETALFKFYGNYWLNTRTGVWGYAGDPRPRVERDDGARTRLTDSGLRRVRPSN